MASTATRRTRIVCISDTHNQTPKLPQGDVLIHAGDLTNQGSFSELEKAVNWLESANFEKKIVVAGNHDVTLDKPWFEKSGSRFRYDVSQNSEQCVNLLRTSPSITYLQHEEITVRLTAPSGPMTTFKIFGSPYSQAEGRWAFSYTETKAAYMWSTIPSDTDIVVTHTPPLGLCDIPDLGRLAGCEALRQALWRVRPKLAVCGHRHPGRGVQRVLWDLDGPGVGIVNSGIEPWSDPGAGLENKKESRVDVSSRNFRASKGSIWNSDVANSDLAHRAEPLLQPFDVPLRLNETCVVNAAYMATSHGAGRRQFNKPIVVDLELPIWHGADDR